MVDLVDFPNFEVNAQRTAYYKEQIVSLLNKNESVVQWQYKIPELGEGGTCSLFGQLQAEPFDLSEYVAPNEINTKIMKVLQTITDYVEQQQLVDWFGIYQSREIDGEPQLLKLTYFGNPSRPLFPINEQYSQISNNTFVALNGEGRVINDVEQYVADGGEYYTCDPKVKSELCLPFFSNNGNVLGIIDTEAFNKNVLDGEALAVFSAICELLPNYLPE